MKNRFYRRVHISTKLLALKTPDKIGFLFCNFKVLENYSMGDLMPTFVVL
jgi:hypothetical protein